MYLGTIIQRFSKNISLGLLKFCVAHYSSNCAQVIHKLLVYDIFLKKKKKGTQGELVNRVARFCNRRRKQLGE